MMVWQKTAPLALALVLPACSEDPATDLAHKGDEQPLNRAQYDHIVAECGLTDASFGSDSFGRSQIALSDIRDNDAMVRMIVCVKGQFEALNAEATIGLPDGQMEAPSF